MMPFALQAVGSMFVAQIVWGRSEIILLRMLCSDVNQVSYYSVAFTMAEQLLLAATIFGTAGGTTIFVQYGRDKSKLPELVASIFRYIAIMSIPLHFIAASLAVPALLLLYGRKFEDAAMVVTLAPLLCIFKAFISPATSLLQCSERQSLVIAATLLAGVADWGIAWWLIPAHGAVGACIGNGAAQAAAVLIMWAVAIYLYKVKLPWMQVAKIAFSSAVASLTAYLIASYTAHVVASYIAHLIASYTVHLIASRLAPLPGILTGGSGALVVLFGLFYLMRVLEPEDRDRFNILTAMLPRPIAGPVNRLLSVLIRPALESAA
jgi:O-antigen/teichoic acid export membrane protein